MLGIAIPVITSGSLFTGDFVVDAMNTLNSTQFGIPYFQKPTNVKGYFKYTPGKDYYYCPDPKNNAHITRTRRMNVPSVPCFMKWRTIVISFMARIFTRPTRLSPLPNSLQATRPTIRHSTCNWNTRRSMTRRRNTVSPSSSLPARTGQLSPVRKAVPSGLTK